VIADKDHVINQRNKEIEQLKAKMEDMAQEFGDMLKVSAFSVPTDDVPGSAPFILT
jgi:hypothetical protein